MNAFLSSPFFGLILCIFGFQIGLFLNKKTGSPLLNPLLTAIILIIAFLQLTGISVEYFENGARTVSLFLVPATASLAVSVYRQIRLLKKNILPVLAGTCVGSLVSIVTVFTLCRFFHLDDAVTASLLPKSVTTAIALDLSVQNGGISSITVVAVVISGILGSVIAPFLISIFKITNPIAQGVAIGTSSHAVGTAKALELGEIQGALSSISIGCAAIFTSVLLLIF